jgi:AraC-like DNA-binding protein
MSVSALYLDSQLDSLESLGLARARALDFLDLSESRLSDPRFRIPIDSMVKLYALAADELNKPSIGMEIGSDFRVASFAKTGRIYAFCRDLVHVIQLNGIYQPIAIDAGVARFVEKDGRSFLHFESKLGDAERYRHITETVFGSYGAAFRWLSWGSGKENKAAYFRHKAPPDLAPYKEAFHCPVYFNAEIDGIEFYPDAVRSPLPTADEGRLAIIENRLQRLLQTSQAEPSTLEHAVRAAIQSTLRDGASNLASVAAVVGRSERQLRSDLKRGGMSFRALLEDVRKEIYHHQRNRGHSFAEIAQDLGYNDQAAFTRAFKRWYGKAPGAIDAEQKMKSAQT